MLQLSVQRANFLPVARRCALKLRLQLAQFLAMPHRVLAMTRLHRTQLLHTPDCLLPLLLLQRHHLVSQGPRLRLLLRQCSRRLPECSLSCRCRLGRGDTLRRQRRLVWSWLGARELSVRGLSVGPSL